MLGTKLNTKATHQGSIVRFSAYISYVTLKCRTWTWTKQMIATIPSLYNLMGHKIMHYWSRHSRCNPFKLGQKIQWGKCHMYRSIVYRIFREHSHEMGTMWLKYCKKVSPHPLFMCVSCTGLVHVALPIQ